MTLENLLAIQKLQAFEPSAVGVQRNQNDYEGYPVTDATVAACVEQATYLLRHAETWLKANRPDLLGETK